VQIPGLGESKDLTWLVLQETLTGSTLMIYYSISVRQYCD